MDAVVLSQVLDLLKKVGTVSPAAGTGDLTTIFKAERLLYDLIGTANPAAGDLTTLFRAAKLLDTKLGTTGDGSGIASVFGKLAAVLADTGIIKGYTDTLETALGQISDAANASGSANAKLAAVFQRMGGGTPNIFAQQVSLNTTPATVLSVTGSGILKGIGIGPGNTYIVTPTITVDGVQIFSGSLQGVLPGSITYAGPSPIVFGPIKFNSSLLITATINTGPQNVGFVITYATGVA